MAAEKQKRIQQQIIKNLLYQNKSIADLCLMTNISTPTCLAILNKLTQQGFIVKTGAGKSIGGRKPDLYGLVEGKFFVLAIEMERYQTKMSILDNNFNFIVPIRVFDINIEKEKQPIALLHKLVTNLIAEADIDTDALTGIGISMPGLVDSKLGHNHTFIISSDQVSSLKEQLEASFKKPVYLQNDVKCYAAAEMNFGLAQNKPNTLVLLMDWGIGLGIIMDGEVRGGTSGFSGEIGHMPFIEDGVLCYCGKRGCLETVASGIALAKMAKSGIQSGQHSLLNSLSDSEIEEIEPQVVIAAANRGDQYAINILADIGTMMGKGLASAIQLFNPELIILGGKMAQANQYITIPMQQAINTYCITEIREGATIQTSELGSNANILGVASNVFSIFLDK